MRSVQPGRLAWWRTLACTVVAGCVLAACGTGSGSKPSSTPESTATPAPLAAADALLASAMRVAADGRGVLAQLSWNVERNGFHISGDGSYVVNAAGDLKLATHYRGQGNTGRVTAPGR